MATAVAAVAAFVLADSLSAILCRFALRRGFVDRPDPRKAHARPTPYLGGVAIATATLAPTAALAAAGVTIPRVDLRIATVMAAAALVAMVGLFDDIWPCHPAFRLSVETVAAVAVVSAGIRIGLLGGWPDQVATVVWIVVLTNAFNLLDNMDGALASVAAAGAGGLAAAAHVVGAPGLALPFAALAAGCLGFLMHNWSPARMFMGDCGSLFIGFLIATGSAAVESPGGTGARLAVPLLVTFVAVVDTCLVVVARPRAGRSILTAGTDHVSHRLRRLGLTTRRVAATMAAVSAAAGLCGVGVAAGRLPGTVMCVVVVGFAVAALVPLWRVPVYERPGRYVVPRAREEAPASVATATAFPAGAGVPASAAAAVPSPSRGARRPRRDGGTP